MVEFVSYTGEYPNLCRGVLTLCIDGEEVRFGHDYGVFESWKTDGNYDKFWVTGGAEGLESMPLIPQRLSKETTPDTATA